MYFFSLHTNKGPACDDIIFTVTKKFFGDLYKPLSHIFNLSLVKGISLDELKFAWITPIFKSGESEELGYYRSVSVQSFFLCFRRTYV